MSHHRSRKADDIELLSIRSGRSNSAAVEAPPPQSGDANDEEIFSLSDLMKIAIVPATVPAAVLLVARHRLWPWRALRPVRSFFEQIAGGALLLTYIKEIFPMLMERLDVHVKALGPTTAATRAPSCGDGPVWSSSLSERLYYPRVRRLRSKAFPACCTIIGAAARSQHNVVSHRSRACRNRRVHGYG